VCVSPANQSVFVLIFTRLPNSTKQDERAKREREKAKWTNVMDEIAKLKSQVGLRIDQECILFTIWPIQR
jgi:hypothetical protein